MESLQDDLRATPVVHIGASETADVGARGQAGEAAASASMNEALASDFWAYAPLGIALFDRDCRYAWINSQLAQLNQLTVEDHLEHTVEEVLPHLAPILVPLLRQVLATGEPILNHAMQGQAADQRDVRHWLATYYPVRNHAGEIVGVGALVIESTDLNRAEAALLDQTRAQQEANARLQLLSRASAILSSSLDITTTLQSVARVAVPAFADWCLVDLVEPDGSLRRVASAHADVCKSDVANAFRNLRVDPKPDAPLRRHGIARVLRTGEPDVVPNVTEDVLNELATDEAHAGMLRGLEMTSYISVPLAARGSTLGVLNFAMCGEQRTLGPDDLALAQELASRAGLAIDNARLYREATVARELAEAAQQRAEHERENAESAAHAKDEFLSILSHELRTPLTSAYGWLQLHRGGKLDEATRQFALETVERALATQTRLVNELLDSSQLAGGRMTIDVAPVALGPLVEETLANLEPAAQAKNLIFDCHIANVTVCGESGRLQQILWNLVANAVKFSPLDTTVKVVLEQFENSARFVVSDAGPGIDAEFLPHIFELFRQFENSATRNHGGLGLGLPIARSLAEIHGGTIEAQSDGAEHGATFTLLLPVLEGDEPADGALGSNGAAAHTGAASGAMAERSLLSGLRVLLVEDEEGARGWMEICLRAQGAQVIIAGSGRSGLEQYFLHSPDVLVSDISMPDGDGYTLIGCIRESENAARSTGFVRTRPIPAIALTAHTSTEDRLRALAAGFQLHIPKPVSPDELLLTVAAVAGRTIGARL